MNSQIEHFLMKPAERPKGWKKRLGFYAVAGDGAIYLPGDVFSRQAFLSASWDSEPIVLAQDGKTALLRSDWLKGEYPQYSSDIEQIEGKIRESLATIAA
jgi:hypothetical protein